MTQTVMAAIILVVIVYLFFSPRFPNSVVAILGTIAMGVSGILPVK